MSRLFCTFVVEKERGTYLTKLNPLNKQTTMKTNKFFSRATATMAAQAAFFYLSLNNSHVTVSASSRGTIEIIVFLEDEEEVELPDGYMTSEEKEEWIGPNDPFKVKRFLFYF